ncbi:MAG: hypothetical protein MJY84_01700 [Bacteroidales bacterium]|nr:hypothetical protein [Bacteroidales bacterium]
MKKLNISAMSAAVLLLVAASCTPDNLQVERDSFISLNLSSRSLETRATKNGEDPYNENTINSVYYFFYKNGESTENPVLKGRLIGLDLKSGSRTEEVPVASTTADALFESSDSCQVFIVANPPKNLESFLGSSQTLEALRSKLFVSSLNGLQESFIMVFDDKAVKDADAGNLMTVDAKLKRLANKFTISLDISDKIYIPEEWKSVPADAKVEFHNAFNETSLGGDFATVAAGDNKFKEKYFDTEAIAFGDPVAGKDDTNKDIWKCSTERPVYSYSMSWDFVGSQEPYLLIELPWKKTGTDTVLPTYYTIFFNFKDVSINNWCQLNIDLDKLGGFQKESPTQLFQNMEYLVLDWNDAFEADDLVIDIDGARYLMMNQTEFFLYNQDTWDFPYTSSHECEIVQETYEKENYRNRIATKVTGNSHDLGSTDIYNCTLDGSLITFHHKLNNNFSSKEAIGGIDYGNYDVVPYTFKFIIKHKDDMTGTYQQEVIVHQYPAIYIEAQPNSAGVFIVPGTGQMPTSFVNINPLLIKDTQTLLDETGNPFTGAIAPGSTIHYWWYYGYGGDPQTNADGSVTIGNSNGNMYVITTAVAPFFDGQEYMLADPRQTTGNVAELKKDINETGEYLSEGYTNFHYHSSGFGTPGYPLAEEDDDIFEEESALYGTTPRTLSYYYPTKATQEAENIIAPKLRIASSWGQTYMLSYDKAVRRCAAYQEDGYPAGRWRVPTAAEIKYICKLSSDHVIPQLFGQFSASYDIAAKYWCSTGTVGVYKVEEKDGTLLNAYHAPEYTFETEHEFEYSKSVAVRCVYDEWYWENRDYDNGTVATTKGRLPEHLWKTPYWGDMPR